MKLRALSRNPVPLVLEAALCSTMLFTGCAARVDTGYRAYDPYYGDYHVWDNNEVTYYNRWESDTHRDHKDFRKRSDNDKKEYWTWRHTQSENAQH